MRSRRPASPARSLSALCALLKATIARQLFLCVPSAPTLTNPFPQPGGCRQRCDMIALPRDTTSLVRPDRGRFERIRASFSWPGLGSFGGSVLSNARKLRTLDATMSGRVGVAQRSKKMAAAGAAKATSRLASDRSPTAAALESSPKQLRGASKSLFAAPTVAAPVVKPKPSASAAAPTPSPRDGGETDDDDNAARRGFSTPEDGDVQIPAKFRANEDDSFSYRAGALEGRQQDKTFAQVFDKNVYKREPFFQGFTAARVAMEAEKKAAIPTPPLREVRENARVQFKLCWHAPTSDGSARQPRPRSLGRLHEPAYMCNPCRRAAPGLWRRPTSTSTSSWRRPARSARC